MCKCGGNFRNIHEKTYENLIFLHLFDGESMVPASWKGREKGLFHKLSLSFCCNLHLIDVRC